VTTIRGNQGCVDIAAWLRGLGLEQYATVFRENAIDGSVLLTLDPLRIAAPDRRVRPECARRPQSWRRAGLARPAPVFHRTFPPTQATKKSPKGSQESKITAGRRLRPVHLGDVGLKGEVR
jgi:hypothetical protein